MKKLLGSRSLPWIVAGAALFAFGASFFQLREARARYWNLIYLQSHDHSHREVREFIIRAELADANQPIVVVGDSITEMARLPATIDGHPVVNAGIGGATITDFQMVAPELLEHSGAPLIVVALGTNDSGSGAIRQNYAALLKQLKTLSPRLLAVGVPPQVGAELINAQIKAAADSEGMPFLAQQLPDDAQMVDRVHLNAAGYRTWTPALVAAISAAIS